MNLETTYISRIITDPSAFAETEFLLSPEFFEKPMNRSVFESALSIYDAGGVINIVSILKVLKDNQSPITATDLTGIISADGPSTKTTPTLALAQNIISSYQSRQYKELGALLQFGKVPPQRAISFLNDIESLTVSDNQEDLNSLVDSSLQSMQEKVHASRSGHDVPGMLKCGIECIDNLGIFKTGRLVGIAARPAMGKSSFARTLARNFAAKDYAVLIFSLEMSPEEITNLLVCSEANVNSMRFEMGDLNDSEIDRMIEASKVIRKLPIDIEPLNDLQSVRSTVVNWHRENEGKEKVVMIDYMQLLYDGSRKHGNRDLEIGYIMKTLMQLTKRLNFCFVPLIQLSRANITRGGDKRPQLSDLRDSGSFEQALNVAMFLHRPEYYGFETNDNGESTHEMCEVLIQKNRHGPTTACLTRFIAKYTKFYDWNDQPFLKKENMISIPPINTGV